MKISLTFLLLLTITVSYCQDLAAIDKKLANLYGNIPDSYSDKQKDARMDLFEKLLLKYTTQVPKTIDYPFKRLANCPLIYISTSEDGNFRTYSIDYNRQQSMPYFYNVYQFRANGKVMSKKIPREGNIGPDYTYYEIHDMVLNGKTYYFAQRTAFGELTNPFSIKFFSIENNQLKDDVKLIQTDKGLVNVLECGKVDALSDDTTKYKINYNKPAQSFSIPILEKGKITKKRVTYKFNGKYFVKI